MLCSLLRGKAYVKRVDKVSVKRTAMGENGRYNFAANRVRLQHLLLGNERFVKVNIEHILGLSSRQRERLRVFAMLMLCA